MTATDFALAQRLLDTALQLGEQHGWEALHLYQIAEAAGVSLADVHRCYQQKDDLVDAWFDRADHAMLQHAAVLAVELNPRQRLEQLLLHWLAGLAPHRQLTRQMLAYKLELGHVHLQIDGLLRISRTVQWWREAAARDHIDLARILDEVSLSSIFVSCFLLFLNDDSAEQQRTRDYLKTALFVQDGLAKAAPQNPFQALRQLVKRTWTR
jgi:AcrR family transcriptional regulator